VFFGENGIPTLRYEIDAYHPEWKCGLEVEAGRGWMGNAVYRDLVQAAVMVGVEYLCLAVSNVYSCFTGHTSVRSLSVYPTPSGRTTEELETITKQINGIDTVAGESGSSLLPFSFATGSPIWSQVRNRKMCRENAPGS
jgi:hypothetical protein